MKMPSISPEDRAQIASAIVSLADEHGEVGMTVSDITARAGFHHRKVKNFMDQYGPDSSEGKNYWKKTGRKNAVTTTGRIIFENLAGSFVSANLGNSGIPHSGASEDSPNDVSLEERLSAAVDILINRHGDNWRGHCQLAYEWESWPEWFVLNRLEWLVNPDFYDHVNRDGTEGPFRFGYLNGSDPMTMEEIIDAAITAVDEGP